MESHVRKAAPTLLFAFALLSSCKAYAPNAEAQPATASQVQASEALPANFDFGKPYLVGALPGGERLIHPMPEAGDPRTAQDEEANARALSLRGSARWKLAEQDADLGKDWFDHAFACTVGVSIDGADAPAVANVLRRAASDFAASTREVKNRFMRVRPFVTNGEPSCTPADEAFLRTNGSYPSGHSAIGYGTSLVLASLFPDRAASLVARGRDYGNSRWICNVHWLSDVEEGRAFATATFARLQSSPDYLADFAAAKAEAAVLSAEPDAATCSAESAALAG